ncbi:hypothetical protein FCN77_05685 [Arthrobacter sp. 24S4-2]|uniref:hypothetical protein n=1 Tax=Arthrobacter sp. 24S4-2 TaxID=2575374 RepID=UPI0010C78AFD|nr:hypothetical protein [Arthrobacter sp. 24S4-2]QCO97301.1 hypothetical protein FCN77_05685 [Arthrobacter sp. 24S4-2]
MSADLLARANRLEKLAKLAQDSEGDKQNLERVKLAADKLSATLEKLGQELATRRALDGVGVPREFEPDIVSVFVTLRDFIGARGRPTPERIQRANTIVTRQIDELGTDDRDRWVKWTTSELDGLPEHKATALSHQDRFRVAGFIRELRASSRRPPSVEQVSAFKSLLRLVGEELGEIELSGPILRVLERFASADGVALKELTDADIAALRSDSSIEAQFVVRRQV